MDAFETYQAIDYTLLELSDARRRMATFGKDLAKAEADYRAAKAKAILEQRLDGTPVTIIKDVIFDDKDLLKKKYLRDAAQTTYDSAHEEVMVLKLKVNVLRDRLTQISQGG